MNGRVLISMACGVPAEEPFLETHAAYAARHGYQHSVVSCIHFPEGVEGKYRNPYKFGKAWVVGDVLRDGASDVLLLESDIFVTGQEHLPPDIDAGHVLAAGVCATSARYRGAACCAILRLNSAALPMMEEVAKRLIAGVPDSHPFEEYLFADVVKDLGLHWTLRPDWVTFDPGAPKCIKTRRWKSGDFALHLTGLPWPIRTTRLKALGLL